MTTRASLLPSARWVVTVTYKGKPRQSRIFRTAIAADSYAGSLNRISGFSAKVVGP